MVLQAADTEDTAALGGFRTAAACAGYELEDAPEGTVPALLPPARGLGRMLTQRQPPREEFDK